MSSHATLRKVIWSEIRSEFVELAPGLAKIIDEINPDETFPFFVASYPFGAMPLKQGKFYLPNQYGQMCHLDSDDIDQEIKKELNYIEPMPVSFILDKNFELFLQFKNYTISPYGLIGKGRLFGAWRVLSQTNPKAPALLWHMTAGARSLVILPKISEKKRHQKLQKKFQLNIDAPTKLFDQWQLFKNLAASPCFNSSWKGRIVFFGKKWFEDLDNPKWVFFKNYLLQFVWDKTEFWRNQFAWDIILSTIQRDKNIKPDPYVLDTVKYLLAMAIGAVPGFAPAENDESGPINQFQSLYNDIYRLEYAPIIMQPAFLSNMNSVYYSLEYPCAIEFSPSTRKSNNKIVLLYQIKQLLENIKNEVLEFKWYEPSYHTLANVKFDFFHNETQHYSGIRSSTELQNEDSRFSYQEKAFPASCPFFQGCIRISSLS